MFAYFRIFIVFKKKNIIILLSLELEFNELKQECMSSKRISLQLIVSINA